MTKTGYLNSVEALEVLGLYNPANKAKPNVMYLQYLNKRGLLKRLKLGHKTMLYRKSDCEALVKKAEKEGIFLTTKA